MTDRNAERLSIGIFMTSLVVAIASGWVGFEGGASSESAALNARSVCLGALMVSVGAAAFWRRLTVAAERTLDQETFERGVEEGAASFIRSERQSDLLAESALRSSVAFGSWNHLHVARRLDGTIAGRPVTIAMLHVAKVRRAGIAIGASDRFDGVVVVLAAPEQPLQVATTRPRASLEWVGSLLDRRPGFRDRGAIEDFQVFSMGEPAIDPARAAAAHDIGKALDAERTEWIEEAGRTTIKLRTLIDPFETPGGSARAAEAVTIRTRQFAAALERFLT